MARKQHCWIQSSVEISLDTDTLTSLVLQTIYVKCPIIQISLQQVRPVFESRLHARCRGTTAILPGSH